MPRFYFHLAGPDQYFRDNFGCDIGDVSTAHLRAVQLADRMTMWGSFADADLRRWTVVVVDARQRLVMTVLFPARFEKRRTIAPINGARALLQSLAMAWAEACGAIHSDDSCRYHTSMQKLYFHATAGRHRVNESDH